MKKLALAVAFAAALSGLIAMTPHADDQLDEAMSNAKVDARLREVLGGMLQAQVEQASLK